MQGGIIGTRMHIVLIEETKTAATKRFILKANRPQFDSILMIFYFVGNGDIKRWVGVLVDVGGMENCAF